MQHWQHIEGPGTIDVLVVDAHAAGHPDVNERLIRTWVSMGLLDHPRPRPAHRGSGKAEYSAGQRRLLLILLEHRREQPKPTSLAQLPLWLWLYGDESVPTRQALKALLTWLGRGRRSQEVTRDVALGPLARFTHPPGTAPARSRLVRLVTRLGQSTADFTAREHTVLTAAVRAVMAPLTTVTVNWQTRTVSSTTTAPTTAEGVVAHAETVLLAVQHLLRGGAHERLLEQTRVAFRASMTAHRHRAAADRPRHEAGEPPRDIAWLADRVGEPGWRERIDGAGELLLLEIGRAVRAAGPADGTGSTGRRPGRT
ncbi:hypothetical protein ABZS76_08880 [Streptomyces sp. NPDC005562]|uniref:hypothetical protein n=1 Tax=Streptomyces sp. NPDC005562 TaxID=3154890 RepID=UPI0033AC7CCF